MSKDKMDKEKKLTITIDGMESGSKVFSDVSGCVMVFKNSLGCGRVIVGNMSIVDMAIMVKVLFSGNDEEATKLKLARSLVSMVHDIDDDKLIELENTESAKINDPFQELVKKLCEE